MNNKKEFFGTLSSVLVAVFLVAFGVYAATTIGDNVQVNGAANFVELQVVGTASISEDLWASGSFQFGGGKGTASISYSRLGAGSTGHSLADADDLLITGMLEIDETAYFDSNASFSDDSTLTVGTILGGIDAGQYLIIGDAGTTSHTLDANDDMLVSGELEVNGTAFFDAAASMSDANGLMIGGGATLKGGTASATGNCGKTGSLYIRSGQANIDSVISVCGSDTVWNPADL